jgi:acyl carrier protein
MTIEKIKELLSNQLNVEADKITAESKIVEDLGADSLDVVELLMTLEEECGIVVNDEDAVKIVTVGDILDLINNASN